MLTQSDLKKHLLYNPETGSFTRRIASGGIKAGAPAGYLKPDGYVRIRVMGRMHQAHRLAWLYVSGTWPENVIDHINGDKADNRIKNLRDVTHQENMRNAKQYSTNTSGVMGVSWHQGDQRWHARIEISGKRTYLGAFLEKEHAIIARKAAEKALGFHKNHGSPAVPGGCHTSIPPAGVGQSLIHP